ncbi:MAG TPA: glycosyltransferase family 2 protein [Puia sp.]|nr:glycosyltransferase family 2 protein [Puia sp.]
MVKYSIILPVRNGGDYLKLAVQSILDQTFPHFELLVLDNCSNDGTAEWLKVKSGQDERLRIFPSDLPLSIEENWGRIAKIPKQEFVTLIGHDDLLFPEYLATMDALVRHHPGASLYQTHFRYIDGKGREIRKCLPMAEKQDAPQFLGDILSASIDIMGTGFMMRSTDYDRLGGIPPYPNLLFADFALWLELTRIAYKATSRKEEFAFRKHLSTTSVSPDIKMQQAFAMLVDYLGNLRKQDKAMEDELDRYGLAFLKKHCRGLAHRLLRTPFARRDGLTVTDFLDDCKQYAKRLVPKSAYDPRSDFSVLLAAFIDSNTFTRNLFLLFKKIYSKPVLN